MRIIDADALKNCIDAQEGRPFIGCTVGEALKIMVDEQPTIEQKTGHWVLDPNGMDWNLPAWVCSECKGKNDMIPTHIRGRDGMIEVKNPYRWAGSHYCPNCGARMEVR